MFTCAACCNTTRSNTCGEGGLDDAAINAQIEARITAKKAKNFTEAERIRKELLAACVVQEDTPQGTTWRRG